MNTTQQDRNEAFENSMFFFARTELRKTLFPLFSIDIHLPKLNVAGSIPVSRSI
jgi:hypothetical protein